MKAERVPLGKPLELGEPNPQLTAANESGKRLAAEELAVLLGSSSIEPHRASGEPQKCACSPDFLARLVPDQLLDRTFELWRANPGAPGLTLVAPGESIRSFELTQPLAPDAPAAITPAEVGHRLAEGYTLSLKGAELVDDAMSELTYLVERTSGVPCELTLFFGQGTALIPHRPYARHRLFLQLAGTREIRFFEPSPNEPDHRRGASGPAWVLERGDVVVVAEGLGDRHHPLDSATMHLEIAVGDESLSAPGARAAMRVRSQVGIRDLIGQAVGSWENRSLVSRAPGGWHRAAEGGWVAGGWHLRDLDDELVLQLASGASVESNSKNDEILRGLHRLGLVALKPIS